MVHTASAASSSAHAAPAACRALSLLACGLSLALLCFVFLHLDRGLECSDEGTYFIHIATPFAPLAKTTDYGSLLHPLYVLTGGSFYALRVIGFLTLTLTAAALGACLLRLSRRDAPLPAPAARMLPVVPACAAIAYYCQWTPTPSYNMLALEGTMAALCCLLLHTDNELRSRPAAALRPLLLLGLAAAGVLTFIGKGTTGAGLAVTAALWLILTPRRRGRSLRAALVSLASAGALAALLLLLYLHYVSEGAATTLHKILNGIDNADNSHGLLVTLPRYLALILPLDYLPALAGYPLWFAAAAALRRNRFVPAGLIAALTTALYIALAVLIPSAKVQGLCAVPFAVMSLYAAWVFRDPAPPRRPGAGFRFQAGLGGAVLACAFVYHTGTNVDVALKLTEGLALVAAGVLALLLGAGRRMRPLLLCGAGVVLCCMSGAALSRSLLDTYRHGAPMSALTEPVVVTPGTRPLLTTPARRDWMLWLRGTARANGWTPGTPLLYTSSQVAVASRLLDAELPAVSWPGEQRYTSDLSDFVRVFKLADPAVLRRAWILKPAHDGPRHMPAAVLPLLGLPFPQGYILLGVSPKEGVWPAERYELWKPAW